MRSTRASTRPALPPAPENWHPSLRSGHLFCSNARMDEPSANDAAYESAAREASRVRLTLNILVVLSAAASSIFLVYVLLRIVPRNGGDLANIEVPTSSAREKTAFLRGQGVAGKAEIGFELRDIDEAAGYRERYSEELRNALGVDEPGRLYQLSVRNLSKSENVGFAGGTLALRDKAGVEYAVRWLAA